MAKSGRGVVCLLCTAVVFSTISYAAAQDRINGPLSAGPKVAVRGNVHGFAKPENDLGRADGNRLMQGVTLAFHPSEAQQKDLDQFIAELGDRSSPNYHKYLTPKQFGQRFGMTWNDLNKVTAWLQSEGFSNIKVANGRNEVSFDGTVAQVESAFGVEMHHYLVDGVVHLANAGDPLLPPALAGSLVNIAGLHNFAPRPRAKVQPHLTSYISGNHFLTPSDFATIYDLNALYSAGSDGTGQKIAIIGQSTVSTTDLSNFRNAAGLTASTVTMTLAGGTGTRCAGDEGESDLDIEWAGGVAKNAGIIFVYAGLNSGDACGAARSNSVWNALTYAVQHNVAPFISTSYGFCESGLGAAFAGLNGTLEVLAKQGQTQGQTIVAAAGDAGAADCDSGTSATQGLAVDAPGSLPEVTSAGGTELSADSPTNTTNNPPGGNPPYWLAAGTTTDTLSSALEYITETGWNDTSLNGSLSATGGGASIFFTKPTWQTGTGVPADGKRDVPDIALSASPDHDPYLFCTEDDGKGSIVATCTSGFRTGAGGGFTAVGGTSADAPTFTAILALINQYLGNTPPTGLAPVNTTLYGLAASTPSVFHDVTTGDNKVPCTTGTTNCPTGTTTIGFSAGVGYDQVTGLGSVDGFALAQAMSTAPGFTLAPTAGSYQVAQGSPVTATINLTPINGFTGQITYTCTDNVSESTCTGPATAVDSTQPASFVVTTKAPIARLERPFDRGSRILYATLLPGLLGIVLVASSRKRSLRSVRFLGLLMVLGFSTIWLGSCGGSKSGPKDPGTPVGSYTITVTGTSGSLTRQTSFTLVVVK
ncbi:MAG: S53 family peptidase [Terriglobales bacterium]